MRKKPQYAMLNNRKVRGKMTLEYMSGTLGFNTCKMVTVTLCPTIKQHTTSRYLQQFRVIQSLADVGILSQSLSVFNGKKRIFQSHRFLPCRALNVTTNNSTVDIPAVVLQNGLPLLQVCSRRELYQGSEGEDKTNPEVESDGLNIYRGGCDEKLNFRNSKYFRIRSVRQV